MANKYKPLTDRLKAELAKGASNEVVLTFDEISALVGGVPGSARNVGWWSNFGAAETALPHLKAWDEAGCFVHRVDLAATPPTITFHRGKSNHANAFVDLVPDAPVQHTPLTLSWSWVRLGPISRGSLSKHPSAELELIFPKPPEGGGLYCFRYVTGSVAYSYVGKTRDFRRRLLSYRSATGDTEKYVEEALHGSQDAGAAPELFIAPNATLSLASDIWALDPTDDLSLVLVEHAAIACEKRAGRKVINRVRKPNRS